MPLICRSTARLVTMSVSAIALLLRPSAIIARIWRSRGVSLSRPGSWSRRGGDGRVGAGGAGVRGGGGGTEPVDDPWVDERAAGGDLAQGPCQLLFVLDP